ncbi:hypothetical protein J2W37_002234 [Variovorax paradoxus]|uniref:hypothetical protein n=1 Tax=Variovorax paradoxus TaxID=34073 RepID=UPI001AE878A1|nr:hypothetical protein [Variovorax paradoxus]MDP9964514.1 hypothetical protein [Variovorax paradoxus]
MSTEFTFPLALCKAQWGVWLHTLDMLETSAAQCLELGSHALRDGAAETRAEADAVAQAADWQALAVASVNALRRTASAQASAVLAFCPPGSGGTTRAPAQRRQQAAPSRSTLDAVPRQAVVAEALRTLHTALAPASPSRRKP